MTTQTEHTPAPWNFVTAHKGLAVHPCHFYYEGEVTDTDIANARLIAAAPELLLSLQTAQKILRQNKEFIGSMMDKDMSAAIAKATGGQ